MKRVSTSKADLGENKDNTCTNPLQQHIKPSLMCLVVAQTLHLLESCPTDTKYQEELCYYGLLLILEPDFRLLEAIGHNI